MACTTGKKFLLKLTGTSSPSGCTTGQKFLLRPGVGSSTPSGCTTGKKFLLAFPTVVHADSPHATFHVDAPTISAGSGGATVAADSPHATFTVPAPTVVTTGGGPTRTALGTAADATGAATLTISGITLAAGDLLVVGFASNNTPLPTNPGGVKWNGNNLTFVGQSLTGTPQPPRAQLWMLKVTAGIAGTGGLVATSSAASKVMYASKVSGLTNGGTLDKTTNAAAVTTTSPGTGTTAATTVAAEFLAALHHASSGAAASPGGLPAGWSSGQSASAGTTAAISVYEAYQTVAATGAYSCARTGATSAVWGGIIATFN